MKLTLLVAAAAIIVQTIAAQADPATPASGAETGRGYNVLFLMSDEHTPKVLGCYGDNLVKTPTFDALAANGVRFTAAYCQNPICVPSRVSLVSGRMPCHVDTFGNNPVNQAYVGMTTLADVFTHAGYQAAWLGKTHWGNPRFQDPSRGLNKQLAAEADAPPKLSKIKKDLEDESLGRLPQESEISKWPMEKNPEHAITDEALRFLEQNKGNKFFLGVSLVKPHFPYTIQKEYYDLYAGKVSPPRDAQKLIDELPTVSKRERAVFKLGEATPEEVQRTKAIYYGMVTYVDEEFGRIVKKLDELGLRENTIIVYTADHGEMLGDRGLWYKNSFYDGAATIPFIWSFPKDLPRGGVVTTPAMNMDVFPTLCDLCQLPKPDGLEGRSLVPVMKGAEDGKEREALSENYRAGFAGRMIRTAQWKYFFYTNGDEYLYDLQADPGEEENLVKKPEYRKLADDLKAKAVVGWVQSTKGGKKATNAAGTAAPQ